MVDFENSTSLSFVSRRKLLTGAGAVPLLGGPLQPSRQLPATPDPIILLWREWQRLFARASALCCLFQDMETHLMHTVDIPQVFIPSPQGSRAICAQSHAEIDRALTESDCSPEISAALHVEFADRRARWDAAADRLGFNEIKQQEGEAWDEEARATTAIFQTRATTLAGVEIKIALMVQLCATGSDDPDFPLPQLRTTMADLKRLRRNLEALRC
jgi:hypothetical protein